MTELIWPFRTKSDSQYRRVDEGWDLQTDVGADVLAILPGLLHYAHDPGTDGGHFGASYPWVSLDQPYGNHIGYYLGHTYPVLREGTRVAQGDVVAHTGNPGNGGAPPGWLEVGWWRNGPEGKGGNWTAAGQDMHDKLINAPVFSGEDDMYSDNDRARDEQTHAAIADVQSRIGNAVQPEENSILDVLQKLRADFDAYVAAHP